MESRINTLKLPLDQDLKFSRKNFVHDITEHIKTLNLPKSVGSKLNFLKRPAFPDEKVLVSLASRVYAESAEDEPLPEGWSLLTTACNDSTSNGYFGAAYWNPEQQQIVVSHRGTVFCPGSLWADFHGILHREYVPQISSAVTFSDKIRTILEDLNNRENVCMQLSFTGHSLGGWLAQITTLTTKYFILGPPEEGSFFIKSKRMHYHAHTVVFESPGCKDMLSKIGSDFDIRYDRGECSVQPSQLDITTYLSAPNLINTCYSHVGTIYRVVTKGVHRSPVRDSATRKSVDNVADNWKPIRRLFSILWKLISALKYVFNATLYMTGFPPLPEREIWSFAEYTLETHSIENMENALNSRGMCQLKVVVDWPLVNKGFMKRALNLLVSPPKVLVGIVKSELNDMSLAEDEYSYFHKFASKVNFYDPDTDGTDGLCNMRYQVKNIEKSKCCTNVFSYLELKFLKKYQYLRDYSGNARLLELFSSFEQHNTEIIEELKTFIVDDSNQLVSCGPQTTIPDFIKCTKNLLHFFPSVTEIVKKAMVLEPLWFDVRESVQSFCGRQEQLDKINNAMQEERALVVISGIGGVGKSELALKYAHDHREDYNVIQINAESQEAATSSFRMLLKNLNLKTTDNDMESKTIKVMAKEVYSYFANKAVLFIFDNATEYLIIESFMPPKPYLYRIIITTRNRCLISRDLYRHTEVWLDPLSGEDAVQFVKCKLNLDNSSQDDDIRQLVQLLGYLPLALQLAVACIEQSGWKTIIRKSVEVYKKSQQEMENLVTRQALGRDNTILLNFQTTIDKIKEEGTLAYDILKILAFFAPENVPSEVFLKLPNVEKEEDSEKEFYAKTHLSRAINLLQQYSVITDVKEQGFIRTHELIKFVLRLEIEPSDQETLLSTALELLREFLTNRDKFESCVNHMASVWNYACLYESIVQNYIVNCSNETEAFTTYFSVVTGNCSYDVVETITNKIDQSHLGSVINSVDNQSRSPLHIASVRGNARIVKLLLEKGANVNAEKKHEWTPLHLAAKNGHMETVKILLKNGADVHIKTGYKFTALHVAARDGHSEVVKLLLENNADINTPTRRLFTPLHLAAVRNHLDVVQTLLEYETTNLNAETEYGRSPLHLAAEQGNLEVVRALLARGASVDGSGRGDFTPLHLAVRKGHVNVVQVLITEGANVFAKTRRGMTISRLAHRNSEMSKFLHDQMASINASISENVS